MNLYQMPLLSYTKNNIKLIIEENFLLSRAKRVTLYLRSSFSMMYPEGPQVYTQDFSELFERGCGRRFREVDLAPPRRLGIS